MSQNEALTVPVSTIDEPNLIAIAQTGEGHCIHPTLEEVSTIERYEGYVNKYKVRSSQKVLADLKRKLRDCIIGSEVVKKTTFNVSYSCYFEGDEAYIDFTNYTIHCYIHIRIYPTDLGNTLSSIDNNFNSHSEFASYFDIDQIKQVITRYYQLCESVEDKPNYVILYHQAKTELANFQKYSNGGKCKDSMREALPPELYESYQKELKELLEARCSGPQYHFDKHDIQRAINRIERVIKNNIPKTLSCKKDIKGDAVTYLVKQKKPVCILAEVTFDLLKIANDDSYVPTEIYNNAFTPFLEKPEEVIEAISLLKDRSLQGSIRHYSELGFTFERVIEYENNKMKEHQLNWQQEVLRDKYLRLAEEAKQTKEKKVDETKLPPYKNLVECSVVIGIDCAPGGIRPNTYLEGALKLLHADTEENINKEPATKLFGSWDWHFDLSLNKDYLDTYRQLLKDYFEDLYRKGYIRGAVHRIICVEDNPIDNAEASGGIKAPSWC